MPRSGRCTRRRPTVRLLLLCSSFSGADGESETGWWACRAGQGLDVHRVVLEAADSLAPLPATVVQLAAVAADPDVAVADIAELIRSDVPLAALILREANSAGYGSVREIDTIEDAVVRLGTGRVVALAVSDVLQDRVSGPLEGYGIDAGELWTHMRAASYVAEVLRILATRSLPASVVTAALLHDVGKVVLSSQLNAAHFAAALADHGDTAAAERVLIADLDHALVGAYVVERWRLPGSIVEAIRGHHRLDAAPDDQTAAVRSADVIAHDLLGTEPRDFDTIEPVLVRLGVDPDRILDAAADRLAAQGFILAPRD